MCAVVKEPKLESGSLPRGDEIPQGELHGLEVSISGIP